MIKIILGLILLVSLSFSKDIDGRYLCNFKNDSFVILIEDSSWDRIEFYKGATWFSEILNNETKGYSELFIEKDTSTNSYFLKAKMYGTVTKTAAKVSRNDDTSINLIDRKHKKEGAVICVDI